MGKYDIAGLEATARRKYADSSRYPANDARQLYSIIREIYRIVIRDTTQSGLLPFVACLARTDMRELPAVSEAKMALEA